MRTILGFCFVLSIAFHGCHPRDSQLVQPIVRDSVGIHIVEHSGGPRTSSWSIVDPPEAVIGLEDRGPSHQLTKVVGAHRLSDGRIVVGDEMTKEVRFFDPRGNHIRTIGGSGHGPGELAYLQDIGCLNGDTLVLGGRPVGNRHWFDEDGEFIRSELLGPWLPGRLGKTLPDGSLLLDSYAQGSLPNIVEPWIGGEQRDRLRPTGVLEVVSRDGVGRDTLGPFYAEEFFKVGQPPNGLAMRATPFGWRTQVAWTWGQVFAGEMNRPEIRTYDRNGALRRILRWEPEDVPVTSGDRGEHKRELMESLSDPSLIPNYERWFTQVEYPRSKPAFQRILANEDGALWVKEPSALQAAKERWLIFSPDGEAIAVLNLPPDLKVLHVSKNHLLVSSADGYGVEQVRSYRLERPPKP